MNFIVPELCGYGIIMGIKGKPGRRKCGILGIPRGIRNHVHIHFDIHADMQVLIHRDGFLSLNLKNLNVLYHSSGRLSSGEFKNGSSIVPTKYKFPRSRVVKSAEMC
jgi:hypothetical protein